MVLKTPTGDVRLDANRQAIGTTFVTEVVKDAQGNLYNKVHSKVDNVDQTLGMTKAEFKMGSRDVPDLPVRRRAPTPMASIAQLRPSRPPPAARARPRAPPARARRSRRTTRWC